jgi:serine/threonine protein kinase
MSSRHKERTRSSLVSVGPRDRFSRPPPFHGRALGSILPGTVVGGRYRIERRLGGGAMGEVWLGKHRDLQLLVAIKTLRPEVRSNNEVVARFTREAILLGRIQSEHVVRVLDFLSVSPQGPVLVTEFVDGMSLHALLASRRLSVEDAIELAVDLVRGLRELHRAHIVHRDVKPGNVLLRRIGEEQRRAVFLDLGISRWVAQHKDDWSEDLTEITSVDRAVGTFEYMAPEQILDSRGVTPAADLYAVGGILHRAVTGRHPFGSLHGIALLETKLNVAAPALSTGRTDDVATAFEAVVARALAAAPADRYESADEMLVDLSLLRDKVGRAGTDPPRPRVPSPSDRPSGVRTSLIRRRRWRRAAVAVMASLCTFVLGIAGGTLGDRWIVERRALVPGVAPAALQLRGVGAERCTLAQVPAVAGAGPGATYTVACDPPASSGSE